MAITRAMIAPRLDTRPALRKDTAPLFCSLTPFNGRKRGALQPRAREIAARLILAERTVFRHVEHILAKLSLRSRTQVATWVVERRGGPAANAR
jgi:hypothetical protein